MTGALIPNADLWYLARGTGLVTVIILSASVALGIVTAVRWSIPRWPRFVTAGLHKNVSLLAVVFLAVHIITTVVDSVSPVHLFNALVPFTGKYRPLGVGLGVVAFDLLAALIISSLLRRRIGLRSWRAIHWSAYACWPFAMLHGLTAGSDSARPWALGVYATCAGVVLVAIGWRASVAVVPRTPTPRRVSIHGT